MIRGRYEVENQRGKALFAFLCLLAQVAPQRAMSNGRAGENYNNVISEPVSASMRIRMRRLFALGSCLQYLGFDGGRSRGAAASAKIVGAAEAKEAVGSERPILIQTRASSCRASRWDQSTSPRRCWYAYPRRIHHGHVRARRSRMRVRDA